MQQSFINIFIYRCATSSILIILISLRHFRLHKKLDRMVDRVKPWFMVMVHGLAHG